MKAKIIHTDHNRIGPRQSAYIIFEVASTHENNWEVAKNYVQQAKEAGANAVKFQLFTADGMINPLTSGLKGTYDYFKTAETPREWLPKLKDLCDAEKIDLLCTPFDKDSATFLDNVGISAMKIASGDLTNHQLLEHVAGFRKPIILSTGMATMEEVERAITVVTEAGAKEIILLQSVSVYPTSFKDANVSVMDTFARKFGLPIGYSDNGSMGFLVPLLATALGATVIDKHVTSQKARGSIDDTFSLSVEEFGEMVKRIRAVEKRNDKESVLQELAQEYGDDFDKAYGDGEKRPMPYGTRITHPGVTGSFVQKEGNERHWARRGVYPAVHIPKGETITDNQLALLRPDLGISAVEYKNVIGATAKEDLPALSPLCFKDGGIFRLCRDDILLRYTDPDCKEFVKAILGSAVFQER